MPGGGFVMVSAGLHLLVGVGALVLVAIGWAGSVVHLRALSSRGDTIEVDINPAGGGLPKVSVPPPIPPPAADDAAPADPARMRRCSKSPRAFRRAPIARARTGPIAPTPTGRRLRTARRATSWMSPAFRRPAS